MGLSIVSVSFTLGGSLLGRVLVPVNRSINRQSNTPKNVVMRAIRMGKTYVAVSAQIIALYVEFGADVSSVWALPIRQWIKELFV